MKKRTRKEEDDERARPEEREAESILGGIEVCSKDLESQLTIDLARQEGLATAKAGSVPLTTEEQNELLFNLAYSGHSYNSIVEIMGVSKIAIDRLELIQVMQDAEVEMNRDGLLVGKGGSQDEDGNFKEYDPMNWETATGEETVDEVRDAQNVPKRRRLSRIDEAVPGTSGIPTSPIFRDRKDFEKKYEQKFQLNFCLEPDFVRALTDSKMGTKPYFRKGHILRVINKAPRKKLDDRYFELLPLKPPGEAGKALIQHFEPADQAAADEVGREAKNEKEIDSFACAMDWVD